MCYQCTVSLKLFVNIVLFCNTPYTNKSSHPPSMLFKGFVPESLRKDPPPAVQYVQYSFFFFYFFSTGTVHVLYGNSQFPMLFLTVICLLAIKVSRIKEQSPPLILHSFEKLTWADSPITHFN